jgi:hypothetical protein
MKLDIKKIKFYFYISLLKQFYFIYFIINYINE